jgi:hypothetical protein
MIRVVGAIFFKKVFIDGEAGVLPENTERRASFSLPKERQQRF